jgi:hypothetical protein
MTRGSTALPAALAALAVSAALAAAVAELTRVEVLVARHRRTATGALVATDACVADLLASLPAGWDFGDVVAGADRTPGTADDGVVPAPPGCAALAGAAPGPAVPARAVLRVEARAGDGRRLVEALVGRDPTPAVPALLWLDGLPPPGAVAGSIQLDGADAADPSGADVAGLAAPRDPAALDGWLAGDGAGVVASGRTGSPIAAPPPPFDALRARMRAVGPAGAEALVAGPAPPPTVALVDGDLPVAAALQGAGLLLVDGRLDIQGSLDFTGIVITTRGLHVAAGGTLTVRGAVWSASSLAVDGRVSIAHAGAAVAAADGLFALPRRAVLLGQRDLG